MNRLRSLREEKGLTQAEFAELMQINTAQSIGNYELGKRDISSEYLIKFSKFFGVSIEYLLGADNTKTIQGANVENLFNIPVVGKVVAGSPVLATENIEKYLPISPEMFSIDENSQLFFLHVAGESMNKIISNGSYVLVKKQKVAENGDIVVAITNDDEEATLKRYKLIDKQFVMLEPESTNSEYQPIIINLKNQSFKIVGKVIGCYKEW